MDLVIKTYEKLYTPPPSTKNDPVYYLNYTINTTVRDSAKGVNSQSTVEVIMNNKQAHLISNEMTIYEDDVQSFTIIPSWAIIYRGEPTLTRDKNERFKSLAMFQEDLFNTANVRNCTELQLDNTNADRQVVLEFDEENGKELGMSTLTFFLNTRSKTLQKMVTVHPASNDVKQVEYTINQISYDYETKVLDVPIVSLLFDKEQELLPKYRNYTLKDRRNPSGE